MDSEKEGEKLKKKNGRSQLASFYITHLSILKYSEIKTKCTFQMVFFLFC